MRAYYGIGTTLGVFVGTMRFRSSEQIPFPMLGLILQAFLPHPWVRARKSGRICLTPSMQLHLYLTPQIIIQIFSQTFAKRTYKKELARKGRV
jgi:hypothetical protein